MGIRHDFMDFISLLCSFVRLEYGTLCDKISSLPLILFALLFIYLFILSN